MTSTMEDVADGGDQLLSLSPVSPCRSVLLPHNSPQTYCEQHPILKQDE